jgi:hypothetical protein
MTFSEEVLMAYADNELDAQTRAAVEAAMAADPEIARRVARHKALRTRLRVAYDKVLDEPVPERLTATVRAAPTPAIRRENNVVPLRRKSAPRWSWPQWSAIAASLVLGIVAGQLVPRSSETGPIVTKNGQLLASGGLAHSLSAQLVSEQTQSTPMQIGVSFRSKSGTYCRTFALRDAASLAGLACREGDHWRVQILAQNGNPASGTGTYRQAGSGMPQSVLQAVDEQSAGEPLDARAEAAARARDWAPQSLSE